MRAHSIGQNSISGRSAITIPPEWMPRWRGKSSTCSASSSASSAGPGGASLAARRRQAPSNAAAVATPPVDPLGERVGLPGREARGLRHLAQRRARPVGDDVRDLRGAVAPVLLVDVLDHLLAALVLDVEVDVGRAVALGREEPLEQQAERDRVGLGDTERVTDRAVRRAPPPLAVDVVSGGRTRRCRAAAGSSRGSRAARSPSSSYVDLAHRLLVLRVRARVADGRAARGRARAATIISVWPSGTG